MFSIKMHIANVSYKSIQYNVDKFNLRQMLLQSLNTYNVSEFKKVLPNVISVSTKFLVLSVNLHQ